MKELEKVLKDNEEILSAVTEMYESALAERNVDKADDLIRRYGEEVLQLNGQRMSNDRLSYYLMNFDYISAVLRATYARQGLARDITINRAELMQAISFSEAVGENGKKLTREDKNAIATKETNLDTIAGILQKQIAEAMDQRIRAIDRTLRTLENLTWMNRSEERLVQ